jgi:hypothetical protein
VKEFAVGAVGRHIGEQQPRIMRHQNEPAAAGRFTQKIRVARKQPRHRMVEAAHQRAVDEETIGGHGLL